MTEYYSPQHEPNDQEGHIADDETMDLLEAAAAAEKFIAGTQLGAIEALRLVGLLPEATHDRLVTGLEDHFTEDERRGIEDAAMEVIKQDPFLLELHHRVTEAQGGVLLRRFELDTILDSLHDAEDR